jgi:putative sigma-54 modulation protein
VLKQSTKWRDTKRNKGKTAQLVSAVPPAKTAKPAKSNGVRATSAANGSGGPRKKVYRVNPGDGNKPMTLEEAMLEMEASQDYMVYRDAQTDKVTVLMRRADGHFDLIES